MAISKSQTIVIADSDPDFTKWIETHLGAASVNIVTTQSADKAEEIFVAKNADLLIAEMNLIPFDGLELLKRVRMRVPNAMVILNGTIFSTNAVIESMRLGAFDVLRRESLNFELKSTAERALQSAEKMRTQEDESADTLQAQPSGDIIIGRSPAMQDVYKLIGRVATADAPVLITGESGVGKEVVSNAIHQFSRRTKGEYVAINCAAIPSNLLESELFGHEKGAFTGAVTQRIGRFEQCDGGTLFLDEIGEMPLEVQSKLLRVLQTGEFSRVGGNQNLQSDVRILAATNRRLEEEVEVGNFREDLFYRLNVVRIHIPPLRKRTEDIRLLAEFFLQKQTKKGKNRQLTLSNEAIAMLESYHWPGNVRELENLLQRAAVLATGNVLLPQDLPLDQGDTTMMAGFNALRHAAETILTAANGSSQLTALQIATNELVKAARLRCKDDKEVAKLLGISEAKVTAVKE